MRDLEFLEQAAVRQPDGNTMGVVPQNLVGRGIPGFSHCRLSDSSRGALVIDAKLLFGSEVALRV